MRRHECRRGTQECVRHGPWQMGHQRQGKMGLHANMAPPSTSIRELVPQVPGMEVLPWIGEVTEMVGLLIASRGPVVSIGDFVEVRTNSGRSIRSQVIGFRNDRVLSMPLEETDGLQPGDRVIARRDDALLRVGPGLLGRVLDGFGRPMDDGPAGASLHGISSLHGASPAAGSRTHRGAVGYRHSRHRWSAAVRQRTARRNLRRQRGRQKHFAGHDVAAQRRAMSA